MSALNQVCDNIKKTKMNQSETNQSEDDSAQSDRLIYADGTPKQQWLNWQGLKDLNSFRLDQHFNQDARVVIVAPHPDDEILGCAGLMQQLSLTHEIVLIAVTNGTASHPHSKQFTPEQLGQIRAQESLSALNVIGLSNVLRLEAGIQDGQIRQSQQQLYAFLDQILAKDDILITTFEKDGHPDHEYSAVVVKEIAQAKQLKHYQVLIWAWHWAQPNDPQIAWQHAYRLDLSTQQVLKKQQAIACFKSQIEPDSSTGQAPILSAQTIDRILMPYEVYIDAN